MAVWPAHENPEPLELPPGTLVLVSPYLGEFPEAMEKLGTPGRRCEYYSLETFNAPHLDRWYLGVRESVENSAKLIRPQLTSPQPEAAPFDRRHYSTRVAFHSQWHCGNKQSQLSSRFRHQD